MKITNEKIQEWKNAIEDEYHTKLKDLQKERDRKVKAIDIVMDLESLSSGKPDIEETAPNVIRTRFPDKKGTTSNKDEKKSIPTTQLIRDAISDAHDTFDLTKITQMIQQKHPDRNISRHSYHSVVSKMIKNGEIKNRGTGGGKIPATYEKVKNDDQASLL